MSDRRYDADRRERWMDLSACSQLPPDMWFPTLGDTPTAQRAKEVCASCPVRQQCLEYAIEHGFDDGIWGGLTPKQRKGVEA